MTTKQYIGARYVPIFGRVNEESIAWDNTKPYEPLTIVLHEGNSYTSRQHVPAGVAITNQAYWALTGNYNAQVESYRQEVARLSNALDDEIDDRAEADTALASDIEDANTQIENIKDRIAGGFVTPEMFGAKGNGTDDDTDAINAALSAAKNVIFQNKTYLVSCKNDASDGFKAAIKFNSNNYCLMMGSTFTLAPNNHEYFSIFNIDGVNDVIIDGSCSIIGDRENHLVETGEYGHGVRIVNSDNVSIRGVKINQTWGDGFTLHDGAKNVTIEKCHTYKSSRNGVSLIKCENVSIRDCTFKASDRTAPRAGIDFEPNPADYMRGVIMVENCVFTDSPTSILFAGNPSSDAIIKLSNVKVDSHCQFDAWDKATIEIDGLVYIENTDFSYRPMVLAGNMVTMRNIDIQKCTISEPIAIHTIDNVYIDGVKFPDDYNKRGIQSSSEYNVGNAVIKNVFSDYTVLGKSPTLNVQIAQGKEINLDSFDASGSSAVDIPRSGYAYVKNTVKGATQKYYIPSDVMWDFILVNNTTERIRLSTTVTDNINIILDGESKGSYIDDLPTNKKHRVQAWTKYKVVIITTLD